MLQWMKLVFTVHTSLCNNPDEDKTSSYVQVAAFWLWFNLMHFYANFFLRMWKACSAIVWQYASTVNCLANSAVCKHINSAIACLRNIYLPPFYLKNTRVEWSILQVWKVPLWLIQQNDCATFVSSLGLLTKLTVVLSGIVYLKGYTTWMIVNVTWLFVGFVKH